MSKWTAEQIPDQTGKTAIVTGANSGLGFHTALELARHGATVILACRSEQRGQKALSDIQREVPGAQLELMLLDVSDLDSVREFAEEFDGKYEQLHYLINNAGIVMPPMGHTKQGFERQIGTNFLGPFALTGRLLKKLDATPGARIVNVASVAHKFNNLDIDDLHFEKRKYNEKKGYAQSKMAIMQFTLELDRRLQAAGSGTRALAAHPGYAATGLANSDMKLARTWIGRQAIGLGNALFANTALQGALCNLYAAIARDAQGGDYIGPDGLMEMRGAPKKVTPVPAAQDQASAARLWTKAEELTGVSYLSAAPDPVNQAA